MVSKVGQVWEKGRIHSQSRCQRSRPKQLFTRLHSVSPRKMCQTRSCNTPTMASYKITSSCICGSDLHMYEGRTATLPSKASQAEEVNRQN